MKNNAGAYATNLNNAQQQKEDDPYAGIGDWIERQDKSNAAVIEEYKEKERIARLMAAQENKLEQKIIEEIAPLKEEKSWWDQALDWVDEHQETADSVNNVFQNTASAMGAVEIARHENLHDKYVLSSPRKIWEQGIVDSVKKRWGWDKVQEKMDLYVARTAKFIEQEVSRPGLHLKTELRAHWSSFSGQARMTWDAFRRNGFDGLNVKPGSLLDFSGSAADIGSAIGYAGYAVTGNESWRTAGQWADVASVPAAVRQVTTNLKPAAQFFTKGPVSKGVGILGKVAGPLAIVTGAISAIPSAINAFSDFKEGDNRMGWANTLSAFSGAAAMVGGVALLIPGAQPVAAIALGLSAVTGVASMAVEYWPTPTGATTPVDTSLRPPTPPISTPVQTGTPTIPPTAVPTLTPTPPATSTPSPTPQVTQTPSPTQTQSGGN